mgnify:CR=1 FL=1
MRTQKKIAVYLTAASAAALAVGSVFAKPADGKASFDVGADIRLRYDLTDHMPKGQTEEKHSDYARVRVRPWIRASYEDVGIFVRLADEFRYFRSPESKSREKGFPDVAFIDNLYFTYKNLFDVVDLKVGRQDMAFGSKRIIADGTGGDGSRSAYFDGVRMTLHVDKKRTLDAFAFYMAREDWLPTLGSTHKNKKDGKYKGTPYDTTGYGQDELGAGLYWQDRSNKSFGYDAYVVYKSELRGAQIFDEGKGPKTKKVKYRDEGAQADTVTVGTRLLPRFTDTLSGEFEVAVQGGSDNLFAGQGYAGLTYAPKLGFKPKFTGAIWALSGDSDGERGKHAWHSVFNRETGLGETIAPMYTKYNYNNLVYPHLAFKSNVGSFSSVKIQAGPLFTAVQEDDADGTFRGGYGQIKYEIKPAKLLGVDLLKGGKLAFQGEYFSKGDYFEDNARHGAFFGRFELAWNF